MHQEIEETKNYGPNERIGQNSKKELSSEEVANISDTEFETLVIRMFTEMIEYGHKIEEEMKATESEINENIQGTNSDGKKTRTQINDLE